MSGLTLDDVGLGDVVRLSNGAAITVAHKYASYTDAEGEHEGPFVTPRGAPLEHRLLSDVVEVVTPNPRRCVYCGEGVTSSNPDVGYCANCHYTGRALEDEHAELLGRLTALDGVAGATFWHTGGGCFVLAVPLADGRLVTPSEGFAGEDGKVWPEPTIPDASEGERWAVVVSRDQESWDEWDEEGGGISMADRLFTEDELVEAVRDLASRPGALDVPEGAGV